MDYHQNARLTIHSREQLAKIVVERGCTLKAAAAAFNVSAKTAAKWVRRYREQGASGLRDRSSRPHRSPRSTSSSLLEKVLVLRRLRHNGWRIALELDLSRATVSRILRRAGLNRLRSLDPPPPVIRYEHKHPGDLIHFDIKRLARIRKPGHRVTGHRPGSREASATSICTSPSTTTPASPSPPSCPTRPITRRSASSSWPGPLRALRHLYPSRAYRQRLLLSRPTVPQAAPPAARQTPLHPALHAAHQRKSRALHPDRAARMGLRPLLSKLLRTPATA